MRKLMQKTLHTLVNEGPIHLVRRALTYLRNKPSLWMDAQFDRRFGIDTYDVDERPVALGAQGEHVQHGTLYQPIKTASFRSIIRALPVSPQGYCFIDFGSGKGRALILAAEAGFQQIIGVEYAPVLHNLAVRNIDTYRRSRPNASPIVSQCLDASEYDIPSCNAVLFFYNPFDAVVMAKVLARIESSWRAQPRDLVVVYRNPKHAELLESRNFLVRIVTHRAYRLYRTVKTQG